MPKQVSKTKTSEREEIYDWNKLLLQESDDADLKVYEDDQFTDEELSCFIQDAFDLDEDTGKPSASEPYEEKPALELRSGIKELMFIGNKETRRKYKVKYNAFMTYIKDEADGHITENAVCNFFHDKLEDKTIGVGSVWSWYNGVNASTKVKNGINLNSFKLLRQLLQNITKYYLPKKAGLLTFSQIKSLLTEGLDYSNEKELQAVVAISLMYFGLLCGAEVRAWR